MTALTDGRKSFKTDSCHRGEMPAENLTALNMLNNETRLHLCLYVIECHDYSSLSLLDS